MAAHALAPSSGVARRRARTLNLPSLTAVLAAAVTACHGSPRMKSLPTAAQAAELIKEGSAANIAATSAGAEDPRLRPRPLEVPPRAAAERLERAIGSLPRWHVEKQAISDGGAVIWATRTTRLFRFVDDVYLLVTQSDSGSIVEARSASRVGKGDLGQNRRNLQELWKALGNPEVRSVHAK